MEVGDRCVLEESVLGDYTYCFGGNDVIYAELGKFNSLATGVRINPVQHPATSGPPPTTSPTAAPTTAWGRTTPRLSRGGGRAGW